MKVVISLHLYHMRIVHVDAREMVTELREREP